MHKQVVGETAYRYENCCNTGRYDVQSWKAPTTFCVGFPNTLTELSHAGTE
jgi:hypothetical protein